MSIALASRAARGQLDAETAAWLAVGFARWLAGDAPNLEVALRLTGGARIAERNGLLLAAARLLAADAPGDWELAGRLAARVRRFEDRLLPALSREVLDEQNLDAVDQLLLDASRAAALIRSRRRLLDLVADG